MHRACCEDHILCMAMLAMHPSMTAACASCMRRCRHRAACDAMSLGTSALSSAADSPVVDITPASHNIAVGAPHLTESGRRRAGLPTYLSPVLSPSGRWLPALAAGAPSLSQVSKFCGHFHSACSCLTARRRFQRMGTAHATLMSHLRCLSGNVHTIGLFLQESSLEHYSADASSNYTSIMPDALSNHFPGYGNAVKSTVTAVPGASRYQDWKQQGFQNVRRGDESAFHGFDTSMPLVSGHTNAVPRWMAPYEVSSVAATSPHVEDMQVLKAKNHVHWCACFSHCCLLGAMH